MDLLPNLWVKTEGRHVGTRMNPGSCRLCGVRFFGSSCQCLHVAPNVGWRTRMRSQDFDLLPRYEVSLVTQRHASLPWFGAQKNTMQWLWRQSVRWVRPQAAARARSVLWQHARVFGDRGSPRRLSALRQGEIRASGFPCRQPVRHEAVCHLRGPALSRIQYQGGSKLTGQAPMAP